MTVRYVVLHHTGYGDPHFDLMLEVDAAGPLLTWRCPAWPMERDDDVVPLPPHRRAYLDYEGDVSGGRGRVRRVDAGTYFNAGESATDVAVVLAGRSCVLRKALGHNP